jgi:hypothetical protein
MTHEGKLQYDFNISFCTVCGLYFAFDSHWGGGDPPELIKGFCEKPKSFAVVVTA